MPSLLAIARRAKSHAPMEELATARIDVATGLEGDSRGRSEGRPVTEPGDAVRLEPAAV